MKKFCHLIVLVSSIVHGQTNTYPASGNVKIFAVDAAWAEGVTVVKPSSWSGFRLTRYDPSTGNYNGNWALGYNASTGNDFSISTNYNGTQYDGLFHISNSTRNVGIGTTSPEAKLDVSGNISVAHFGSVSSNRSPYNEYTNLFLGGGIADQADGTFKVITDGASNYFAGIKMDRSGGNVGAIKFYSGASISGTSYTLTNSDLENYARMSIVNGNVGIGTTNPISEFQVNNGYQKIALGKLTPQVGQTLGWAAQYIGLNMARNSTGWVANYDGGHNGGSMILGDTFGQFRIVNIPSSGTSDQSLTDSQINQNTSFLISSSGNVGIGTISPDAKLAVSGQVHAQEVKVSVTVPGPDYVFEKDYKLTSLEEIKNYIDQNKHLPEVPSAKEMEKNGVQLGEMNMLLLKKIEELTLYTIEMNRKMEELKKENSGAKEQMQIEINQLKK